ncbi:putative uncharacterized protein DDB_G0291812 [Aplysia californica]|uniref:Uncharacterized protein n=1 Tax=Aplysia californica TaxID=6500 RepID=A0ABM0JEB2_APLCA|nr:putative uncharacterized protein DDB_G0291812 [Aplysia californica]
MATTSRRNVVEKLLNNTADVKEDQRGNEFVCNDEGCANIGTVSKTDTLNVFLNDHNILLEGGQEGSDLQVSENVQHPDHTANDLTVKNTATSTQLGNFKERTERKTIVSRHRVGFWDYYEGENERVNANLQTNQISHVRLKADISKADEREDDQIQHVSSTLSRHGCFNKSLNNKNRRVSFLDRDGRVSFARPTSSTVLYNTSTTSENALSRSDETTDGNTLQLQNTKNESVCLENNSVDDNEQISAHRSKVDHESATPSRIGLEHMSNEQSQSERQGSEKEATGFNDRLYSLSKCAFVSLTDGAQSSNVYQSQKFLVRSVRTRTQRPPRLSVEELTNKVKDAAPRKDIFTVTGRTLINELDTSHQQNRENSDLLNADIRRLQGQVLDAQSNVKTQFRTENLQKLYHLNAATPLSTSTTSLLPDGVPVPRDPDSQPYHEHLSSSLQAFRARKWRPLTPDQVPGTTVTRCRPISGRPSSSRDPNLSLAIPLRPSSEPTVYRDGRQTGGYSYLYQRRPDTPRVNPGNFDTLSPRILSHLVTDPRPRTPNSSYGDVIETTRRPRKSKRRGQRANVASKADLQEEVDGDVEDVSHLNGEGKLVDEDGEDKDGHDDNNNDDDDDDVDSESDSDSDSDNDSISELEKGNEPPVDSNRTIPDLHLRPERLDHVYTPENKRDMRRFDFDAEKVDIPAYEFECPIPAPFTRINFRFHARENSDWRYHQSNLGPADPELSAMFDRLVDISRRVIETEEWEEKRMRSLRKRPASRAASANRAHASSAATSAMVYSRDNKRCCSSCLQAACVGDCPDKRVKPNCCENCRQPLCTDTCDETKYEQRMRQPRDDASSGNASRPPLPSGPRSCRPCQRRHTAKLINANNVVLGRPNSAFSTYSRGKSSAKPKTDLRPTSAFNLSECIYKGIEKLGIDAVRPTPPSSAKPGRPRGRGDMMPGKTCFSNLSRSLTDLSPKRKRRTKSAKTRSIRTSTA